MRRIAVPAFLTMLASAGAANAHARLVSATPAANATVSKPEAVELHFSEGLIPAFTGADVAKGAIKVAVAASIGADGRTLVLKPRSPLGAGRYDVAWHAVSADTHRVTGRYAFTVR